MKRWISLALWGLSTAAFSAEPEVMVPANAAPVTVSPGTATPLTLSATAMSTVSATPVVTLAPTPVPTPTESPVPALMPGPSKKVQLIDSSWALVFKAGGVLPLGDRAQYNQSGPAVILSGLYHANADYSVDVFTSYSTQAYKVGGGATPLNNIGLGVKLLYNLAVIDGITWYAGGGAGAYYNQRTKQVLRDPVINNKPEFDPTAESSLGLGLLGTLGGRYETQTNWGFLLELNIVNINLAGGTSDNILLAQPVLGLSYAL